MERDSFLQRCAHYAMGVLGNHPHRNALLTGILQPLDARSRPLRRGCGGQPRRPHRLFTPPLGGLSRCQWLHSRDDRSSASVLLLRIRAAHRSQSDSELREQRQWRAHPCGVLRRKSNTPFWMQQRTTMLVKYAPLYWQIPASSIASQVGAGQRFTKRLNLETLTLFVFCLSMVRPHQLSR